MATKKPEVVEQKRIGPGEYDKPEGGGFPLGPLLAGLGALGAAVGLAALDPKMFLRRFARASLKALKNLIERLLKTFKGVIESIGKVFKKIFNAIAENVKKLKNLIDDKLLNHYEKHLRMLLIVSGLRSYEDFLMILQNL